MAFTTYNGVIYLDPESFTTAAGDNNDVLISSSGFRVTCTSNNDAITGLNHPMGSGGAQVWISNVSSSNVLVLKANNTSSTSGYRFVMGKDIKLLPAQSQHFGFIDGVGWVPIGSRVNAYRSGQPAVIPKFYSQNATTTSGVATFYLTDDFTSSGNALFTTVYKDTAQFWVEDTANAHFFGGYTLSGDNKTLTITSKTRTFTGVTVLGVDVLGSTAITNSSNGTVVRLAIWGD